MLRTTFYIVLATAMSFDAMAEEASLYQRLGGEPVVHAVVVQTVAQVSEDSAVNQSFEGVNIKKLDDKIVEHICALTGGGCEYKGENMKVAHGGLKIGEKEFYALVEALRSALDSNGVGEREKNELLNILAPMKRDIVNDDVVSNGVVSGDAPGNDAATKDAAAAETVAK